MRPIRVFIGFDSREPIAFAVLAHSILRRASQPLAITPLVQAQLRASELYTRPPGMLETTEFSLTRFLVPYLSGYSGYSIFLDCDMLCQVDLVTLIDRVEEKHAVSVCQHDYHPKSTRKFLDQSQSAYPRKNWSSLMVFNNARCRALSPTYVNTATGLMLHRYWWLDDDQIGSLPLDFNHLVGEYEPNPDAKILHYTNAGPWFDPACDHADLWLAERDRMVKATSAHLIGVG